MKFASSIRRVLTGIAALLTLATAVAQTPPKVQLALVADASGAYGLEGAVLRYDTRTGKFLGAFGAGAVVRPTTIAVQPSTNVVFVGDTQSIKRFDMSTGRLLGVFKRDSDLGGTPKTMRFAPSGDLYTVVAVGGNNFRIVRLNPVTGATLGQSLDVAADTSGRIGLGFRPNGNVEMLDSLGIVSYADNFTPDLATYLGFDAVASPTRSPFRTSSDVYLRFQPDSSLFSGFGTYASGDLVLVPAVDRAFFAEAPLNQTFMLGTIGTKSYLYSFDTSGVGLYNGVLLVGSVKISQSDMAIYAK